MGPANNISPWMARVYAMLEDGPIKREDAISEAAGLIPPGRADRAWRNQLEWSAAQKGHNVRSTAPSDRTIRSGSRMLVQQSLWTAEKRGRIGRYRDENGVEWIYKARERRKQDSKVLSERARAWNANKTPEERSASSRKGWETYNSDLRRLRAETAAAKALATLPPEERSARSSKGWETRRQNYTPEQIAAQQSYAASQRKRFGPKPRSESAGGGTPPSAHGSEGQTHGRPAVRPLAPVDEDQARTRDPHDDSDRGVGQGER